MTPPLPRETIAQGLLRATRPFFLTSNSKSLPREGVNMTSRKLISSLLFVCMLALFPAARPASADSSHARIIRLSLVQGDVRFARGTHGDPLADSKANWETAGLNLPIRQNYVLATDNGRAEVEFENGAMAFLKENTVLEFYDLSLRDGARTTRLVLRQGSASFYVNPASGDFFSVTGGDFTVEANGRTNFRLDNFDDGSSVEVLKGRASVLHKDQTTPLDKGQSLSVKAGDDSSVNVGRVSDEDDFDHWVSGRIDGVSTATASALQYTSSPYYTSGFADLYTYGSFFNCGGYGYGWRPFGVGFGWSPFTAGQWAWDPGFGWTWISFQPWGWAPYHYGGWLFDSSCGGWFYSPPVLYGFPGSTFGVRKHPGVHPPRVLYQPATAVFVRQNGKLGIVPMHPLDQKGKTPLNIEHGVFSAVSTSARIEQVMPLERGQKLETLKSAPREALSGGLAAAAPPARVSRTLPEGNSGTRAVSLSRDSSITYDPREHRFVNTNGPAALAAMNGKEARAENELAGAAAREHVNNAGAGAVASITAASRNPVVPSTTRGSAPPPVRNITPPPAPRYSGGGSSGRGSSWGGSSSASSSGSGRSSSPSSSSGSHPSSSSGRPH